MSEVLKLRRLKYCIYDLDDASGNLGIRRFFTLDTRACDEGALSSKVKELLGLIASKVLRCDDCISYHIIQSVIQEVTDDEFWETFNIVLVVSGSILIPHLRRGVVTLEECRELEINNPEELRMQGGDEGTHSH